MTNTTNRPAKTTGLLTGLAAHLALLTVLLGSWEAAARSGAVNPTFFGQPSGIATFLWENLFISFKIWIELGWTLLGTLSAFILGSVAAILTGLLFVSVPRLERFLEPYLAALNAMPRIALAPLLLLWFGLGVSSKIAIGFSLVFFIVLASTTAGMRSLNMDHVTLSKTLGVSGAQLFRYVTLPSAVPVIFSGLRLGLIYALLGVVGGEIIAAEHGLGQNIAYLSSTFNMNGVLALLLVLALLGMAVTSSMTAVERRLLQWQ
jgi:NitT/TauT family transport system permease protein